MEHNKIFITEEINEWIEKAWLKHQVNVVAFAFDWINCFQANPDMWQAKHKRTSRSDFRELEILMMYFWLHEIEGDDENYWQEYLNKTLIERSNSL